MQAEIDHIISLLTTTFEKDAWHGPAVKEVLSSVSEADARKRIPDTHSIIELVAHMTTWRRYVVRMLQGDAIYTVSPEMNFPSPSDWTDTLQQLYESQRALLSALRKFPASRLLDQVPAKEPPLTYYAMLHGIIHHDLYHTGQIMLIRKGTLPQPL